MKILITWNFGSLSSLAMAYVFLFAFSGPEIHQAGITSREQIWKKLQRHFWNSVNQQEQFSVQTHYFVIFVHFCFPLQSLQQYVSMVPLSILPNDMQKQSHFFFQTYFVVISAHLFF